jgi:hypothetical protein
MAISASGLYGLTLEKFFLETVGASLESETAIAVQMVTDGYTPNFDTHDFENDVTNEVSGTGYTAGGVTITTTELAVGSPAAGQMNYDSADPSWASSTITDAMAAVGYVSTGTPTTAELVWLSDFVTAASTSSGTFTIQVDTNGWFYFDFTP